MLLVFRGSEHVATVEMPSFNLRELRASLVRSGLQVSEVEMLMRVAEGMAS